MPDPAVKQLEQEDVKPATDSQLKDLGERLVPTPEPPLSQVKAYYVTEADNMEPRQVLGAVDGRTGEPVDNEVALGSPAKSDDRPDVAAGENSPLSGAKGNKTKTADDAS